jgi:hypothetical protein
MTNSRQPNKLYEVSDLNLWWCNRVWKVPTKFVLETVQERHDNPTSDMDDLNVFLALHQKYPNTFTIKDVIAAAYISV